MDFETLDCVELINGANHTSDGKVIVYFPGKYLFYHRGLEWKPNFTDESNFGGNSKGPEYMMTL